MVAVKSADADRLLAKEIGSYGLFLVHGGDVGLVSERVRHIVSALVDDPADPFQLARLTGDDVTRDPGRLADEARTVPLFGGRRAVLVEAGTKNIQSAVEAVLGFPEAAPVVIEAGTLRADAPLRKMVEQNRRAAAIDCAPDGEREIARLIDDEMAAAGRRIDPEAKTLLISLLGSDRLASRSEIAKLLLFTHGRSEIGVEDVEAIVADASAEASDDVIDAAFGGDLAALDRALTRVAEGAVEAGQLLGAALRHATRLHRSALAGDAASFRYGLSPRRRAAMDRQLAALGPEALSRSIVRLGEAIGQARREPRLAESHAARALWALALGARPRKPRG